MNAEDKVAPAPSRGGRLRRFFQSLGLIAGSVIFTLLLLEVVLRFFPVSTGLASVPTTAADPVFHFQPNRDTLTSMGWDMHNPVRSHVNNVGFTNWQDYVKDDPRPMIGVVGDSFIEAQVVSYPDTLQGRLAKQLADKFRVYSFGAGGAPLSQYLIWAQYAVKEFAARAVVINVIGNDFDESLSAYRLAPGFWQYAPDPDGTLRLHLYEHHPGLMVTLVRHSALARYLVINLHASALIFDIRGLGELIFGKPAHAAPRMVGATDPNTDPKRVKDSLAAIDAFFRDLPVMTGLPPDHILFTVDGFRYPDAREAGRGDYFDLMRTAFIKKARSLGYEAIDLDDWFIPRFQRTGEYFEFPDDGHWTRVGHGVAAEAVMASKMLARLREEGDKGGKAK